MKNLTPFAKKVLDFLKPDAQEQEQYGQDCPLAPVSQAPAMQAFVRRIQQARDNGEKILVAGDYDCDGMMATAIMLYGLRAFGIEAERLIPNRFKDGYGLSAHTVEKAAANGYSLIITVDNGVKAKAALEKARALGVEVIVTDHHQSTEPVNANIVIHPDTLEEAFSTICGAGAAFECVRALGIEEERFLQWTAIASIADCMAVTKQTRAYIQQGLASYNASPDPHLYALYGHVPINESDVSFQIAPRINAIGRMADRASANSFVTYLSLRDPARIRKYAASMEEINNARKELSDAVSLKAEALIKPYYPVLIAAQDDFHEGVIGLAAGALSKRCNKPVILASKSGGLYKASMRAPEGFACLDFLTPFGKFTALGGHARAAGFSIKEEDWPDFEAYVLKAGSEMEWTPTPQKALPVSPEEITVENVKSLDALRPFGTGFEAPRFVLDHPRIVSTFDLSGGRHRKYTLAGGVQMLLFRMNPQQARLRPEQIEQAIGTLSISTYRGQESADFLIDELKINTQRA